MDESEVIQKLRSQLKEAEEERKRAAEHGLQLLNSHNELENHLDEMRAELTNNIEKLEQDKYSLQREVELKNRMLDSLTSEYENVRQQQKFQLQQLEEQLQRNHSRDLNEEKFKLEKLRHELDETRLNAKQLSHKLEQQSEALSAKTEELRMMSERVHESMSSEMLSLQIEKTELESSKAELEEKLSELMYRQEQLELSNVKLARQLANMTEEKEEKEKEAISFLNALQKAREANQDLQIQLDQALQQAQDPNSKGNSLFAEVEDRRAEMEKQLISMKVQYQSLQKQYTFCRQQMHRLKVQIATLLQMKATQGDQGQLERLHSMLEQKNSEIQTLTIKLKEKMVKEAKLPREITDNTERKDRSYYEELLKMKLDEAVKKIDQLNDELSVQRMKALAESQRVLEVERKLFSSERQLELCQSENIQLRVKLDEMKLKYEPNEMGKSRCQKRRREKFPVDIPSAETELTITKLNSSEPSGPDQAVERKTKISLENSAENHVVPAFPESLSLQQTSGSSLPAKKEESLTEQPVEKKRVRIKEETKDIPVLTERNQSNSNALSSCSRLSSTESKMSTEKPSDIKTGAVRAERKAREKCPIIYVSSEPASDVQCAQQ